jgi:hypothetical protein
MKKNPTIYRLNEFWIRDIVLERIEELGVSKYDLANHGGISAAPSTVYRFLRGEQNTFSGHVEEILHACGLAIVSVDDVPAWAAARAG